MTHRARFFIGSLCAALLITAPLSACKRKSPEATPPVVTNQTAKRYGVKSGSVSFVISGSVVSGEETMQFDNYGEQEVKETNLIIDVNGVRQEYRQLTILRDGFIYAIDLEAKRGTKMPDVISQRLIAAGQPTTDIGRSVMQAMGGREIGNDTVLDHECTIWEIVSIGSTSCIKEGVPLSAEARLGDVAINYVATAVDLEAEIPAEEFSIPTDVTITDAPAPSDLALPPS